MKNNNAWVFKYLAKKGKSLDTLEKAIGRMTKAEILEKFEVLDWGLCLAHSKKEMTSIILQELESVGFHHVGAGSRKQRSFESPYFHSRATELAFYLLELEGGDAMDRLGITRSMYRNRGEAEAWYSTIISELGYFDGCDRLIRNSAKKAKWWFDSMMATAR